MLIALDYDDTWTRHPLAWFQAMRVMQEQGHDVIGATLRYEQESGDMDQYYKDLCGVIYFTGREPKRAFLANLNVFPDVWIDDTPEFIVNTDELERGGL